jgi:hypothetical protein
MKQSLLSELKKNNPLVRVEHFRLSKKINACLPLNYFRLNKLQHEISPHGGLTLVSVKTPAGKNYSVFSRVHPHDAYKNKLGVHLCVQKIMAAIQKGE